MKLTQPRQSGPHLFHSGNELSGEIPPELSNSRPYLTRMDLSGNELSGDRYHRSWAYIANLTRLDLCGIELSVEIPP